MKILFIDILQNIPLTSILDYVTLGTLIALAVGSFKFYNFIRSSAIKETQFKELVDSTSKELEAVKVQMALIQEKNEIKMKDILTRVDNDKDSILKKVEEIDIKSEARFNKLTELIIDLFKKG